MAADEQEVYGSWEKDRVLGCGGFGTVTLWKNSVNDDMIGKVIMMFYSAFNSTLI